MDSMQTNRMNAVNGAYGDGPPAAVSCLLPLNTVACQDVTEDHDDGGDGDGDGDDSPSGLTPAEEVVGFSMGQEQLRMKSPDTPAYEKAKALDQFKSYFEVEHNPNDDFEMSDDIETLDGALSKHSSPSHSPGASNAPIQPTAASSIQPSKDTGMIGTLRKLLPDIPSISAKVPALPRFDIIGSRNRSESQVNRPGRSTTLFSKASLPWISPMSWPRQERIADLSSTRATPGPHSSDPFQERRRSREKSLRRSTSDNSLFMRHDLTRVETLEGAEKWSDTSEMLNARFKAITDSLQDSSMTRMPKLPSINFGISKHRNQDNKEAVGPNKTSRAAGTNLRTGNRPEREHDAPPATNDAPNPHPILKKAISSLTGDVVILGGYRGSVLRSAKPPNKQLWVPVKVGINLRRVDLEIGLNDEDEDNMRDSIISSGVLSHIGPIDICRRLMKNLKKSSAAQNGDLRVHDYGYDWRLSPHLLSRDLIQFLEKLKCNTGGPSQPNSGAVVIAHSLGGMIARHAVNQRPDLFAGVVYAGTPSKTVNILGPLRNGDDVLLSSRVLTAQVNFTIRSSYALLPEDGKCFINKITGERYDIDFFDAKSWAEHCLSPCVAAQSPSEPQKSIVGAISDSLPSMSFSKKRNSMRSSQRTTRDMADMVKEDVSQATKKVEQGLPVPRAGALVPDMEPASSQITKASVATASTIPRTEALTYLERTLKSVRRFKEETAFRPSHQAENKYPPISILYGDTVPTVFGARVESREAIKRSDCFDSLAFAVGDGIVLAKSARPPEGYKIVKDGLVRSDRGHIGLLGDLEGVGKCIQAIINARNRGVGVG